MIEFVKETLLLLPFLFATYLVLEAVEAHAGGALGRILGRARSLGPVAGALAGAVPQCGTAAAAASFYAGGVITAGTLIAVFLSTSDELIPVLISNQAPVRLLVKIVALKVAAGIVAGFAVNAFLSLMHRLRREVKVSDLCAHSRCGCDEHRGIVIPAIIHTVEIFAFIAVVSGAIHVCMHYFGEDSLLALRLNTAVFGSLAGGALGLIPNCAVSVAGAELYCSGAMSASALMASSFTGSGLGILVLFRTNRNFKENFSVLALLYFSGVLFGWLTGFIL